MGLVVLTVIGQPHTLPLLLTDLTGLNPFTVNSRNAQNNAWLAVCGFCLEDVHTLDSGKFLG